MASSMGFSLVSALFLVAAVTAAREDPFAEEKTYAPPYGSDAPSSGVSPVVPTPDVPYTPPYTPSDPAPATPYTPDPSTPSTPAPSTPGTCSWWSKNTSSFPDLISILSTLIDLFGSITGGTGSGITTTIASIFGGQTTVMQSLTNTRPDGFGALAREGSAALLNSLTRRDYQFNPLQVKMQFRTALQSQQHALATARLFQNANIAVGAGRH